MLSHLLTPRLDMNQALVFTATKAPRGQPCRPFPRRPFRRGIARRHETSASANRTLLNMRNGNVRIWWPPTWRTRSRRARHLGCDQLRPCPKFPKDYVHRIGRTAAAASPACHLRLASTGRAIAEAHSTLHEQSIKITPSKSGAEVQTAHWRPCRRIVAGNSGPRRAALAGSWAVIAPAALPHRQSFGGLRTGSRRRFSSQRAGSPSSHADQGRPRQWHGRQRQQHSRPYTGSAATGVRRTAALPDLAVSSGNRAARNAVFGNRQSRHTSEPGAAAATVQARIGRGNNGNSR